MKCLIIIPCYNEEESIIDVVRDIDNNLDDSFSYLVVDDGSTDNTRQILINNNVNHIHLPINLGLSSAVQCGYKYAYENDFDVAVQFDGDGQHKACYIEDMLKEIQSGANIVIGSRFVEKANNINLRVFGGKVISFFIRLKTGVYISDPTSGMRMLDKKNIFEYAYNSNYRPEPDSLVAQIKKENVVKEIPVTMNERKHGKSVFSSPFASISYMIRMIISIIFIN